MASFLSSVPELMDAGLGGSRPSRGRALALRLGAIGAFLALWSVVSGAVVVFNLFHPIFLPGPWLVLGSVLDMAVRGQLWIHLPATLERVAIGFATGAALGVALGLAVGQLAVYDIASLRVGQARIGALRIPRLRSGPAFRRSREAVQGWPLPIERRSSLSRSNGDCQSLAVCRFTRGTVRSLGSAPIP